MAKLDRYILKQILSTFIFTVIALCVIFIIVNLMETLDKFIDNHVSFYIIAKYYITYLPEILKILTPVSILIASLLVVGRLSNNNELTAARSGGMSLYRIIIPIGIIGVLLSGFQYLFNGWIVPAANEEKARLGQVYLNKGTNDDIITNIAFRSSANRNVLIQYYDAKDKIAQRVAIEDYKYENDITEEDDNSIQSANTKKAAVSSKAALTDGKPIPRLISRIDANHLKWNQDINSWEAINGTIRKMNDNGESITLEYFDNMPVEVNISDRQLARMNKKTDQLTFSELEDYIYLLKQGGKDIRKMEINYRSEQALPLANFIVILFGVSFASVKKRGGLAVQIAAAMVIAFSYLMCFQIAKPIGLVVDVSPVLVGWSSNIIFFIIGFITILKTRT